MKRTGSRTEPWETPNVSEDEGEMCGEITTADARNERYEVNHCSETEEMPNLVERRWSRMEWSKVSWAAERSRRQRQETCCIQKALKRWSCRESNVVSVE